jgi:hypothetical protein
MGTEGLSFFEIYARILLECLLHWNITILAILDCKHEKLEGL